MTDPNGIVNIPVHQDGDAPTIDARDLHSFLKVKTKFSQWLEGRIEKCGFVEDIDFFRKMGKSTSGRPTKEYDLTISMAKELCMLERNKMGKQARLYFISIEQKFKQQAPKQLSATDMFLQAAQAMKEQEARINNLNERLSLIERDKNEATQKLLALPDPEVQPKEKTIKAMIRERLNTYANIKKNYPECWKNLYKQMYYRYQVNVGARTVKGKKNGLDVLEELDLLKEAYAVACEIFTT